MQAHFHTIWSLIAHMLRGTMLRGTISDVSGYNDMFPTALGFLFQDLEIGCCGKAGLSRVETGEENHKHTSHCYGEQHFLATGEKNGSGISFIPQPFEK